MWRNKRSRNKKFYGKIVETIGKVTNDVPEGSNYIYLAVCIIFKCSHSKFLFFIDKIDEKVLENMKWLETNEAPWTEVLFHWM